MEKTTVFKKNLAINNHDLSYEFEDYRSKNDGIMSEALGYELSKEQDTYLKWYLADFNKVSNEHRVRYVAVFDFETTDRFNSFGVSMAIMLYDIEEDLVIETFYELMNPLEKISKGAYDVHGISQEEVENEKTFKEHIPAIENLFEKADMFCGHNLAFDLAVLEREYKRLDLVNNFTNIPVFDTMKAARDVLLLKDKNGKKIKNPTLVECVEFYGLDTDQGFHNALIDVQETLNVFTALLEE